MNDQSSTDTPVEVVEGHLQAMLGMRLKRDADLPDRSIAARAIRSVVSSLQERADSAETQLGNVTWALQETRRQRNAAETTVNDFPYVAKVAMQTANLLLAGELDIVRDDTVTSGLPWHLVWPTCRYYVLNGENFSAIVIVGGPRSRMYVGNAKAGIKPYELELGPQGLTTPAVLGLAGMFARPVTPFNVPSHLKDELVESDLDSITRLARDMGRVMLDGYPVDLA